MPVSRLLNEMTSAEISECMAFDQLKDDKYRERLETDMMTPEQQEEQLMLLLGYKK